MVRRRRLLAFACLVLVLAVAGCVGQTDDRTDTTVITDASVADFSVTDRGCTVDFVNDIDSEIQRDDVERGVVVDYSRNVSLPSAGHHLGEPQVEALNDTAYTFDVPVEESADGNGSCTDGAYARYDATVQMPRSEEPWLLILLHDGVRVGSIRSDEGGSNATARAGASTSTAEEEPSSSEDEAGFEVAIEDGDRTVWLNGSSEVTVELRYSSSGGPVEETSWDTIQNPSGAMTGVLDYDSYAEVQLSKQGEYVIQLTATSEDGELARDTTKIVVR